MIIRQLVRKEVDQIWEIDRGEVIENVYYLRDGELVLEKEYYDMAGWPSGTRERYSPMLYECFDRGGVFFGAFKGQRMVAVAVLDSSFLGKQSDQLQLKFLHVSRSYRAQGLGKILFQKAVEQARARGARKLYISATPSENAVRFYLNLGCIVTREVDPKLYDLEPEDIHLEYRIP